MTSLVGGIIFFPIVSIRPILIAADSRGTTVPFGTVPPRTPRIVILRLKGRISAEKGT